MTATPEIEEVMNHIIVNEVKVESRAPVRVWADGCFDLMHWGHANALRQAKQLGDILVVGIHSDTAIRRHKGPPVMSQAERYAAVASCKWVDEIVENAPYVTCLNVLEQLHINYCVHGEDTSHDENGNDTYAHVKQANKYKEIKRSEGVSTTEIVGRMVMGSREHLNAALALDLRAAQLQQQQQQQQQQLDANSNNSADSSNSNSSSSTDTAASNEATPVVAAAAAAAAVLPAVYTLASHFLPSSKLISEFSVPPPRRSSNNNSSSNNSTTTSTTATIAATSATIITTRTATATTTTAATTTATAAAASTAPQRIVYVDGAFDLFHVGHISALQQAAALGDYLIVGVHSDAVVHLMKNNRSSSSSSSSNNNNSSDDNDAYNNLPILNLQERVLSVLSCRYVDEVVFAAPWCPSVQQLQQLRVAVVAHGSCSDYSSNNNNNNNSSNSSNSNSSDSNDSSHALDPYASAKALGIWHSFTSKYNSMTTSSIIQRIFENRLMYEERNRRKAKGLEAVLLQQKGQYEAEQAAAAAAAAATAVAQ